MFVQVLTWRQPNISSSSRVQLRPPKIQPLTMQLRPPKIVSLGSIPNQRLKVTTISPQTGQAPWETRVATVGGQVAEDPVLSAHGPGADGLAG